MFTRGRGIRRRESLKVLAILLWRWIAGVLRPMAWGTTGVLRAAPPKLSSSGLTISWDKGFLDIQGSYLPGGYVRVWYIEAFCRSGSTDRPWPKTVIPQHTELTEASRNGKFIKLLTKLDGDVEVLHDIQSGEDEVDFHVTAVNRGRAYVDAVWAQPCVRVESFTGCGQEGYLRRSFIFLGGKLVTLDKTRRVQNALYKGGQVYVPRGIDPRDVNPRPVSPDAPSNGLIGCFSADGRYILATAWEPYQELFQGVIVCLHSDFRLGGLKPGETKTAHGKIYVIKNDARELLRRYRRDFGHT